MRDLPKEWRTPLYALTAATVSEVVGGVVSVSEIPSKGPLVVLGPVLDRLYDAYEIYEASKGVAEAQNTTLYAIAMGAEATAELAAKYPSERTDAVVDLWKKDTVLPSVTLCAEFFFLL